MSQFRLPHSRGNVRGNVRGLKKEEEDKVSLFYSEPPNLSYSAMNADIQDMEERIMMEQRLLKEVTEESISLPLS